MALRAVFCQQNVPENAEPIREALSSVLPNGGGVVQSGDFAVAQTSTPSMQVTAAVGRIWVPGTNVAVLSGTNWSTQGMYFVTNDALANVTVPTADPSNPRIDIICVTIPDSAYAGSVDTAVIQDVSGTPIAGASYPTNAPALPANSLALAWITVGAAVTSIVNANITSLVTPMGNPFGHMGKTNGFQTVTSASTVVMGGGQVLRGGMTFNSGANALVVPIAGLYRVTCQAYFSGAATGTDIAWIMQNGAQTGINTRFTAANNADVVNTCTGVITAAANDQFSLQAQAPQSAWGGSSGYSGFYLEVEYRGP